MLTPEHLLSGQGSLIHTLLAIKLCDSSFLCQHLDLIHSHFTNDGVMSFIF